MTYDPYDEHRARKLGHPLVSVHPSRFVPNRISYAMAYVVNEAIARIVAGGGYCSPNGLTGSLVVWQLQKMRQPFTLEWRPEGLTIRYAKGLHE